MTTIADELREALDQVARLLRERELLKASHEELRNEYASLNRSLARAREDASDARVAALSLADDLAKAAATVAALERIDAKQKERIAKFEEAFAALVSGMKETTARLVAIESEMSGV